MAFRFSEKSWDFIRYPSTIDILEGTARSSKTTSLLFKFGLKVNNSSYNQHFISASDAVTARRNLIDNERGFLDLFAGYAKVGTDPKKGNHLIFKDAEGREKIIYILGFGDAGRWRTVLGSTMGCGLIDEINLATQDFINEVFRAFASLDDWYLGATLNPDNPDKEIYTNLINKCRPVKKWVHDIPNEIITELKTQKITLKNAIYWHFNFRDNPVMTEEKIDNFKSVYPPDSFYYKSKIEGIRGVAEGVIFAKCMGDFLFDGELIKENLINNHYIRYSIGVDLGNNEIRHGTILTFTGVTARYMDGHFIDTYECTSTETNQLVNEIALKVKEWLDKVVDWSRVDGIWVDGYGAIAIMIPTLRKKLQSIGIFIKCDLCYKFGDEGGRMARMLLMLMMLNQRRIKFNTTIGAKKLYTQLRKIVYDEDGLPLDNNELQMDYYDSACYSLTKYTTLFNERTMI